MEAPLHVISTETIKPSSKHPSQPEKLKLSYLDQLSPSSYVSMVFFYQVDELKGLTSTNHTWICERLKQSLSTTLTSFYPYAGRIQDSYTIDCNGAGAEFIEARVRAQLTDVIQGPQDLEHLKRYLATDASVGTPLVIVKITSFDCGGIAIGVSVSHKIADCASIMGFVNAWASTCRGEPESSSQKFSFNLASYFPSREIPDSGLWIQILSNRGKQVTQMFLFDKGKIAALRQVATSSSGSTVKDPTRVELVSAFIWKSFMDRVATLNNSGLKKGFVASHAVNLRGRTSPPQLLENVSGNCSMIVWPIAQYDHGCEQLPDLVRALRSSFRAMNEDYIAKAQRGDCFLNDVFNSLTRIVKGELEWCGFSSWCRFPVYQVDYGWGNPILFFTALAAISNSTILLDSRSGDGIEAWVTMTQDVIENLEAQIKTLSSTTENIDC